MSAELRHGVLFGLVLLAALWLRTHDLAARPMHTDEANQAVKLGLLLETGRYEFDPRDHHGPTLYYFAVPLAGLRGESTLAALTETTARLTPALFGTLSVFLLYLLARPLGRWPALAAAALLALSPPTVYYSRYFIQESLHLAFKLAACVCGQRWWRNGATGWAVATGASAGLMLATKESATLLLLLALGAFVSVGGRLTWRARLPSTSARGLSLSNGRPGLSEDDAACAPKAWRRREVVPPSQIDGSPRREFRHLIFALLAALGVAVILYSSFFTHIGGLPDALAAFAPSFDRAVGGGSGHEKPWWYYASLFVFHREGGLIWDQTLFLALALGGLVMTAIDKPLPATARWVAVYTALVAIVFSAVPYKTPWLVLSLVPGLAILAAVSLARLRLWVAIPLAGLTLVSLGCQTRQAVFLRPADERNPLAYVHTVPDMFKVPALAAAAPAGPIKVISEEYWPLPWYLRARPEVGYWTEPPADCDGPLVFASAGQADAVRARLHGTYRESYLGLRPGFVLVVFAK